MDLRSSVTASDPRTRRGPRLPALALARTATAPAYAVCATYTLIAPPLAAGVLADWRLQRRSAYLGTDGPAAAEHRRAILTGVHPDLDVRALHVAGRPL